MDRDARSRWNAKALDYPRYEEGDTNFEAKNLKVIAENGVNFSGKRVLDIGSGSGMYTIRIAKLAKAVTALDISDKMLEYLMEDAAALGLTNITPVNSDWMEFQPDGKYDIIFASMTPALFPDEAKAKLMGLDSDQIVYMAYAGRQSSNLTEPVYEKYGITRAFISEADNMKDWLEEKGIAYRSAVIEGEWRRERSLEWPYSAVQSAFEQYAPDVVPDKDWMQAHFEQFRTGEGYLDVTQYRIEVIIIDR